MVLILAVVYAGLLTIFVGNVIYMSRTRNIHRAGAPTVSVLIPARNEARNLQRLLPSLLSQSYPNFEVIVVDDASEDGTWGVLSAVTDARMTAIRGTGPPAGWVGKVHALFQATREATGDVYLFLDADAELLHPEALGNIVASYTHLPDDAVLTGLTSLRGGGRLLVSMVTHAMLVAIPWFLVRRGPPSFGALNGQCWMIAAAQYRRLEPHQALRSEVLEDVRIGRFLARHDLVPTPVDVQHDLAIHMYDDFGSAWRGFRKNAYLVMGGAVVPFIISLVSYWSVYLVGPILSTWFAGAVLLLKGLTDRRTGFPPWVTLLTPVSFMLGAVMQFDSALAHWRGRVRWKDRVINPANPIPGPDNSK